MGSFLSLMTSSFTFLGTSAFVMAENAHISFFIFLKSLNLSLNSSPSLVKIALYCSSTSGSSSKPGQPVSIGKLSGSI